MTQVFKWPITIYYEDTDAGGVVYHSNYLKFFERARTEILREKGVSQQTLLENNLGFVVSSADLKYIQGAKLDEQLTVNTQIESLRKATIIFKQQLVNKENKVLCESLITIACVNTEKMKPQAIPTSIQSELSRAI